MPKRNTGKGGKAQMVESRKASRKRPNAQKKSNPNSEQRRKRLRQKNNERIKRTESDPLCIRSLGGKNERIWCQYFSQGKTLTHFLFGFFIMFPIWSLVSGDECVLWCEIFGWESVQTILFALVLGELKGKKKMRKWREKLNRILGFYSEAYETLHVTGGDENNDEPKRNTKVA